jgi:hypothetical protein
MPGQNGGPKPGPAPIPLDQLLAANQKALAAATRLNAKMFRDMMRVQQHMLGFISRRIENDISAAEALSKCGDGPEIMAVAQQFCERAMSDYADEAAEFVRISVEAAQTAAADAAEEARTAASAAKR